jgi:hypothetical protein
MTEKDPYSLYRASPRQAAHDFQGTIHDEKGQVILNENAQNGNRVDLLQILNEIGRIRWSQAE